MNATLLGSNQEEMVDLLMEIETAAACKLEKFIFFHSFS
jgi:hypothetical protein